MRKTKRQPFFESCRFCKSCLSPLREIRSRDFARHFTHLRQEVTFGIFEIGEPQIVVGHRRLRARFARVFRGRDESIRSSPPG